MAQERHIHITSKPKKFELNLKEVWQYKDLIFLFTKREFQLTYKQTVLGPLWIFVNPIITSLIYAFVFGGIAGIETAGVPQILFYLTGNAIWTFFSSSVTKNASTFTSNSRVFGKVYFPRLTVPISNVLSNFISFVIQMSMTMVFLVIYLIKGDVSPNWTAWLLIPFVLVHLGAMGLGFGLIISSFTTKYRDLSILVGFGMSLWMYATPIVYPISTLDKPWMEILLWINPTTAPIELFRYAVLGQGTVNWLFMTISLVITVIVLVIGIMIFNRVEKTFMDTV